MLIIATYMIAVFTVLGFGGAEPISAKSPVAVYNEDTGLNGEDQQPYYYEIVLPTPILTPVPTTTPEPTVMPDEKTLIMQTYGVKSFKYPQDGHVVGYGVNVRSGPGIDYSILVKADFPDPVIVYGELDDWLYVFVDDQTGFIHTDFVNDGSKPSPTPKPTPKPTKRPTKTKAPASKTPSPTIKQGENGKFSDEEVYLAAQLAHRESGSTLAGCRAVLNVVINRMVRNKESLEETIFAKNQFSVTKDRDKFLATKPGKNALQAAEDVLVNGMRVIPEDVLYFKAASKTKTWGSKVFYETIGGNDYYRRG